MVGVNAGKQQRVNSAEQLYGNAIELVRSIECSVIVKITRTSTGNDRGHNLMEELHTDSIDGGGEATK